MTLTLKSNEPSLRLNVETKDLDDDDVREDVLLEEFDSLHENENNLQIEPHVVIEMTATNSNSRSPNCLYTATMRKQLSAILMTL
jgi:hypothetical protein